KGKYVLDVCTCFTCQVCGGYDVLHYLEESLGVKAGQTTPDGLFTIQEAECPGACGSAPLLQVTNGPYVHNLTRERRDARQADLGGNRRSDAEAVTTYRTPPVAETLH